MRRLCLGALALALCFATASCQLEKMGFKVVAINGNCLLVDADGNSITKVKVNNNDLVMWLNSSDQVVKVLVSDRKILSGRSSVRLSPGEATVIRVGRAPGVSTLTWFCGDGGGGGTTPIDNNGDSDG